MTAIVERQVDDLSDETVCEREKDTWTAAENDSGHSRMRLTSGLQCPDKTKSNVVP